jgi:hypothetical protein
MKNTVINDIYDRISKILKNDQKYTYSKMGALIITYITSINSIDGYYQNYPPLLDVVELGAALEYEGSEYPDEIVRQIRYKMSELKHLLPDIS